METRFHVTLLSNFVIGYDKYHRRYSKDGIPGCTFPDQFFLLHRDELQIGIDKATPLLNRLALPGDRLIVLESRVRRSELHPNERTGLGKFVARNWIELAAVHFLEDDGSLMPMRVEEVTALSFQTKAEELSAFAELAPRSVSVLPIAIGCQAACPFCFSKGSTSSEQAQMKIDLGRVEEVYREARNRGASRAVITGGGEPGMVRQEQLEQLITLSADLFPKVVMISNGYRWARLPDAERLAAMQRLRDAGLSVLSVSRHHHGDEENARIMHLDTQSHKLAETWEQNRAALDGLRMRWVCVLQKSGVDSAEELSTYLDWAASTGVGEICFKELYVSASTESEYYLKDANEWSFANQVPLRLVLDQAEAEGWTRDGALPWGAPIFSLNRNGRALRVAAYTEPSVCWERQNGQCRSWNVMSDGRCLVSLEDRNSVVMAR